MSGRSHLQKIPRHFKVEIPKTGHQRVLNVYADHQIRSSRTEGFKYDL